MGWGEEHAAKLPPNASTVLAASADLARAVARYRSHRSTGNEEGVFLALDVYEDLLARPY